MEGQKKKILQPIRRLKFSVCKFTQCANLEKKQSEVFDCTIHDCIVTQRMAKSSPIFILLTGML
jgi:hypothetical protein